MTLIIIAVFVVALVTTAVGLLMRTNRRLRRENAKLYDQMVTARHKANANYVLSCAGHAKEIAELNLKLFQAEERNAQLRLTIAKKDMLLRQKWEAAK